MKYNEFKEQQKALGKVSGVFSFLAYIITFKTKELLAILSIILIAWVATLVLNPAMAASIKKYIVELVK